MEISANNYHLGYDPPPSNNFIQSLLHNVFQFAISSPAIQLNAKTVKIQLSKGESANMLIEAILKEGPSDTTLIISYPS
ncbi:uncharacterized protein G2W53_029570 [Senna tora]|uniref:Uncharacterized protein n=1 Tax=Senna tora TaxID=362788 RepID=A0A834WDU0_9FABA|nr:uncharacterized protein G2W53_029570 [Senna tora]